MGNKCTSCCGESTETQLEIEQPDGASCKKTQALATLPAEEMLKQCKPEMLNKLHKGLAVGLILQDRSRLECTVTLAHDNKSIELACDSKSRRVLLSDIKSILYTPDQLKRVDCSAGISKEDLCVALHLAESGNCIPLFFSTASDRDCFVIGILRVREELTTGSAAPAN